MSETMKIELPYVIPDTSRHGTVRYYFRRPGQPKIRIQGDPASQSTRAPYGSKRNQARSHAQLGNAFSTWGFHRLALRQHEEALSLFRGLHDRLGEADELGNMAGQYLALGDVGRAIELHEVELAIAREIMNPRTEAYSLYNLSNALHRGGRYQEALQACRDALELLERIGAPLASKARARLANWTRAL